MLVAVAAFGLPAAITATQQLTQERTTADAQDIYIVRPRSLDAAIEADGELEAEDTWQLSFQVSGKVKDLYVSEGDTVREGDVIAVLENEQERIALANAEVNLQSAQVQRDDIVTVDEDEVRLAEARLENARNSYGFTANQVTQEDLRAAELELQAARDSVNAARRARIVGGGDTYEEAVTNLEAQIGEAQFEEEVARLRLENLRDINAPQLGAAGASIEQAQAELERVRAGATEYEMTSADLAVEAAQQNVEQARVAFDRTFLRAPAGGTIASVNVEVGQQVGRGQPVARVIDIDPLHALVEVDEIDYPRLEVGMEAVVILDALPNTPFGATVSRVAPEGEEINGVVIYETEVELQADDPRLRPSMTATAYIGIQPDDNMLVVPENFIAPGGEVSVVREDGTIETINITTGETTPDGVEVTSGLNNGDALIIPVRDENEE